MMKHGFCAWMQCKEAAKRGLKRILQYGEGALELLTQQCVKSTKVRRALPGLDWRGAKVVG